jgi:hypothetical protein
MRLASRAIFGSLLINVAFGLVVTGAVYAARPALAALAQCTHHTQKATHQPISGHFLAAVRMGWAVG